MESNLYLASSLLVSLIVRVCTKCKFLTIVFLHEIFGLSGLSKFRSARSTCQKELFDHGLHWRPFCNGVKAIRFDFYSEYLVKYGITSVN